jgi:Ca2+-binding EF-hand superfamily protein
MGGAGRKLTPRATLMHGLYGGLDEGAILSAFQTCDRDGSGALEKDEFLVFLRALNDETTEKDADTLFARCDNDGSELVTLVEFLRAWRG